jgi:hypothetical protein
MTEDDKALVERLKRFSTRPIEHDAPAMNRVAMDEAAERIEAQAAEIAILRQPQTDALHDQLLQECLVKLRDVQGTQAPKQYACNLIKRIERVLQGQNE